MWPKSVGKNPDDYVADEVSRLDRAVFERDVRNYVGSSLASELRPTHFQVLFEISDEYCRTYSAICSMKAKGLTQDWKSRRKLMVATDKCFADLQEHLKARILDPQRPPTALLAKSVSDRVLKVQRELKRIRCG
jgi:hypothetical protein